MNYKSLTIIALVLMAMCVAVPVSAMWNNGNWVSDDKNNNCDNVKFDPKTGVTSCYRDINPVNEIKASENGNGGWAEGSIRAGYSTLSDTIYVRNILQEKNVSPMAIKVNADATFRIPEPDKGVLAPGNYSATLDNFNLPDEIVYFTIAANQQGPTYIAFLGQAASQPAATTRTLEIVKALYGETKEVCGSPVTEYRYWIFEYGFESGHVHAKKVGGNSQHDFDYNGDKYQITGNKNDDAFIVTSHTNVRKAKIVDTSHWSEWSTDKPCGYYEHHGEPVYGFDKRVVEGQCHTVGNIIDVTSIVQGLVSHGHLNIIADYPNQHYNALFTDPAPGIFKHLSVDYKINGGVLMHKTVAEDEDLNI